ncbi:AraC family transcriptional regulator [Deltaproteobacteria bacterium]|nr:AraC family transcriptional regulator [Deltaproteobacteria bacterium]
MFYISVSILQRLIYYISSQGINPEALFKKAGIDQSITDKRDDKMPLEDYYQILDCALDLTEDPYFGLHMGETGKIDDLSILGYVMSNCRTLGDALEKAYKYFGIIGSNLNIDLKVEKKYSKLIFEMRQHFPYSCIRHCIDTALTSFFNMIGNITSTPVEVKEVWIKADAPEDRGEYKRIFNCPVLFGQPISALILLSSDLATPLNYPNPELLSLLEHHAKSFLNKIDENDNLSRKISLLLFEKIQQNNPSVEEVSKSLGMSVRVLQKRLKKEETTFSQLATNVREELAKSYLAERHYTVDDITYLVGFSEPSAFRRAFKMWTGLTPRQYRLSTEPSFKKSA